MKFILCLISLAIVAVNADGPAIIEPKEDILPVVLDSSPQILKPNPTLAPAQYKPKPTLAPTQYKPKPTLAPVQYKPVLNSSPQNYKPKSTLAPASYKPLPTVITKLKPTHHSITPKVVPTVPRRNIIIKPSSSLPKAPKNSQSGAYNP